MKPIQIFPVPSPKIIDEGDDIVGLFLESMKNQDLSLEDNDIIAIASKVISYAEKRIIEYKNVKTTQYSLELGEKAKIPPEFAQIILDECDNRYIGAVPGAITTINKYGLLANAGADQSNVKGNRAILLPLDTNKSAKEFHLKIKKETKKIVGIVIADSRTMPMRLGTVGCALGTYGFKAVLDERGKDDLFNRSMHITNRAIADQLSTAAELVMGETNEQIPFVLIRNYPYEPIDDSEEEDINELIPAEMCMFIGPLLPCIEEKIAGERKID